MADISTYIKERILLISDYLNISKEEFTAEIGTSYGNFRGKSKYTSVSSDTIAEISTRYPQININWVLTGKGEMLNEIEEISCQTHLENVKDLAGSKYTDEFVEQLMENHTKLVDSHQKLSEAHYLLTKEVTETKKDKRERKLYTQKQTISQVAEPDVEYKKNK